MKTDQNSSPSPLSPKAKRRRRRLIWVLAPLVCIGAVAIYIVVWRSRGPNLRAEGIASMTLVTSSGLAYGAWEEVTFDVVEGYRTRAIIAVMNGSRRTPGMLKWRHDGQVVIKYSDGTTVKVLLAGAWKDEERASTGLVAVGGRYYRGLNMSTPELFALGGWDVAETVVPLLVKALGSEGHRKDTRRIVEELVEFGEGAKLAVPALRELVNDPDKEVGARAAFALAKIDPGDRLRVPLLTGSRPGGKIVSAKPATTLPGAEYTYSPSGGPCKVCGAPLFWAIPHSTSRSEIIAFAKASKTYCNDKDALKGWIHPGVYCANGCTEVWIEFHEVTDGPRPGK